MKYELGENATREPALLSPLDQTREFSGNYHTSRLTVLGVLRSGRQENMVRALARCR
jgi:hypothetical protein